MSFTKEAIETKEDIKQKIFCNICCDEKITFIKCLFCNSSACSTCHENYILTQLSPRCMSCNKEWSHEFLQNNFTKNFINKKYKEYRKEILFEIEKNLLPQSQVNMSRDNELKKIEQDIKMYKNMIENLKIRRDTIIRLARNNLTEDGEPEEKSFTVKNCPINDCRGFLSTKYNCGVCGVKVCSECLEPKNIGIHDEAGIKKSEEHKCNPETLETVKLIKKDCKNCPKCSILVHKTQGCDVMWCTQCKTPFSWKTGKIITTGNVHNPHYFEYLASIGEDIRQIVRVWGNNNHRNYLTISQIDENNIYCVNFENLITLLNHFRFIDKINIIREFTRKIMECEDLTLHGTFRVENLETKNDDIRRRYLSKEIDESQFKSLIHRRQKRFDYNYEINLLLQMFINLCKEEFCKLFLAFKNLLPLNKRIIQIDRIEEYQVFKGKILNLQIYLRENLKKISDRYDFQVPKINILEEEKTEQ